MALPSSLPVLASAVVVLPLLLIVVARWRGGVARWKLPMIAGVWLTVVASLTTTVTQSGSPMAGVGQVLVSAVVVVASIAGMGLLYYSWRLRRTDPGATVSL